MFQPGSIKIDALENQVYLLSLYVRTGRVQRERAGLQAKAFRFTVKGSDDHDARPSDEDRAPPVTDISIEVLTDINLHIAHIVIPTAD